DRVGVGAAVGRVDAELEVAGVDGAAAVRERDAERYDHRCGEARVLGRSARHCVRDTVDELVALVRTGLELEVLAVGQSVRWLGHVRSVHGWDGVSGAAWCRGSSRAVAPPIALARKSSFA